MPVLAVKNCLSASSVLSQPKKPKKRKDGSRRDVAPPPGIIHAEDPRLGLRFVKKDPQRIALWIIHKDTKKTVEAIQLYSAFSAKVIKKMFSYHNQLTSIQPLTCGKQVNWYSAGKMFPIGTQAAMGGSDRDVLHIGTAFPIITFECNLSKLQYQESIILTETTRSIFPQLVREMSAATAHANRLGLCGCLLFKCDNYTSSIHADPDRTVKSISAQVLLHAKKWEYAFCAGSFDGDKEHCCLLPSTDPLNEKDIAPDPAYCAHGGVPARASIGRHKTVPERFMAMAEEYQEARETSSALEKYWDGDVS
ncbi:hypothetical protein C8R44DRAFT_754680 [Mycena epipterygia]|nr:hypothetical protein C8R44DRAFT_754680 [Mycena epipterygia]